MTKLASGVIFWRHGNDPEPVRGQTQLSKLVERAAAGEEIVIAKAGKPMAKLVPLGRKPLRSGLLKGKIWMADDFDDTSEEIICAFNRITAFQPRTKTIEWP